MPALTLSCLLEYLLNLKFLNNNLQQEKKTVKRLLYDKFFIIYSLMISVIIFVNVTPCHATFIEQILGNTKTISLANTVTAYPPDHMSIHYNPAGLSKLKDGKLFSQGLAFAALKRTVSFTPNPDFKLMNEYTAVDDDPISNTESEIKYGKIFMPGIGPINMPVLIAPAPLGISYREPGSRWTFATGIYAPYAGGLTHEAKDPARYQGKSVYIQHIIVAAPTFSYKFSDTFSFGLSIGIGMSAMGLQTDARTPNDMVAMTQVIANATDFDFGDELLGDEDLFPLFGGGIGPYDTVATTEITMRDSFTPHYNLGMLWEPKDWFSFGIVYQSATKLNFEGRYRMQYSKQFQKVSEWLGGSAFVEAFAQIFDIGTEKLEAETGRCLLKDFQFPQRVQFGVMLRPIKQLRLLCDLHWANWSTTEKFVIEFDQKLQALRLIRLLGYTGGHTTLEYVKNFEDTWHYSFGIEYSLFDWLAFRAGYENRISCAQTYLMDLMSLPDIDNFGIGMGINLPRGIDIDFALGYLFYHNFQIPDDSSITCNSHDFSKPVYNPYAGQNLEVNFNAYLLSMNISMPFETMNDMIETVVHKVLPFMK